MYFNLKNPFSVCGIVTLDFEQEFLIVILSEMKIKGKYILNE